MPTKKRRGVRLSAVLAAQVKAVRQHRELSQQQLADEMASIGAPLDRSALAKIESQSRGVSAEELIWLSIALGCAPSALLVPYEVGAQVDVAPALTVDGHHMSQWLRGLRPLGTAERPVKPTSYLAERTDDVAHAHTYGTVRAVVGLGGALETHAAADNYDGMRLVLDELAKVVEWGRAEIDTREATDGER